MNTFFIGTLVSVFNFLNNEEYQVLVKPLTESKSMAVAKLQKGRIYNIPAYQREIRWKENHISELVHDISAEKNL